MLAQVLCVLVGSYAVRSLMRWRALSLSRRELAAVELAPPPAPAAAVALIANPIAGVGSGVATARVLLAMLRRAGWRADLRESHSPGDARRLASTLVRERFTHVVSIGGDGQLHEVLNGLCDANGLDCVRVGIFPEGTGNGVCTSLGLHTAAHAARSLASGECAPLDLWSVETEPASPPVVSALSIGWGAVADIDGLAERRWRWLGPARNTLIAAYVVARYRGYRGRIWLTPAPALGQGQAALREWERALATGLVTRCEGGPRGCTHLLEDSFFLAHACNVASIASDFQMAPWARPADGCLTLCVQRHSWGWRAAVRTLIALSSPIAPGALDPDETGASSTPAGLERYACTQLAFVPAEDAEQAGSRFAIDGEELVAHALHASHAVGLKGSPQMVMLIC